MKSIDATETARRIGQLVNDRWQGNFSLAAREVHCSTSTLTRAVAGKIKPGHRLVELIVANGKVNRQWLLYGLGKPFGKSTTPTDEGYFLPVVDRLLPNWPCEEAGELQGQRMAVPPEGYSDSRYIMRVQGNAYCELFILEGDLVHLETNPDAWQKNLQRLDGRICGVRLELSDGPYITLGMISATLEPQANRCLLGVRVLGGEPIESKPAWKTWGGRGLRHMDTSKEGESNTSSLPSSTPPPEEPKQDESKASSLPTSTPPPEESVGEPKQDESKTSSLPSSTPPPEEPKKDKPITVDVMEIEAGNIVALAIKLERQL